MPLSDSGEEHHAWESQRLQATEMLVSSRPRIATNPQIVPYR
jgi:hypothetical protein